MKGQTSGLAAREGAADLEPGSLATPRLDGATRLADDVLHDREPEPRASEARAWSAR